MQPSHLHPGVTVLDAGNGGVLGLCPLTAPGPPAEWLRSLPLPDLAYIRQITHPENALRSAVGRWLCGQVVGSLALPYQGTLRAEHGRPFLLGLDAAVSLSHSAGFAAVIVNPTGPCGIDLEQIRDKAAYLAPRFLAASELAAYDRSAETCTLLWCLKEAAYKRLSLKGLSLRDHLRILAISPEEGTALVESHYGEGESMLTLAFAQLDEAWLCWG